MERELEKAIRAFRKPNAPPPDRLTHVDDRTFRASVDLRLQSLERQLDELKGRINGLLFVLAGAVATQVLLRLFV
jgi:hypothetical protein